VVGRAPIAVVECYHIATADDVVEREHTTELGHAALKAAQAEEWVYDRGDDPAFYSAERLGGPLSWGICRRNVRNQLRRGDVVCYIGFEQRPAGVLYRLVGHGTVERKVSQQAIWEDQGLEPFRAYLNVIIEPIDGGYRHRELHTGGNHDNWLWRLTDNRHGLKEKDFEPFLDPECQQAFVPGQTRVAGKVITIAANYLIFDHEAPATVLLADPPVVAIKRRGEKVETWFDDPLSSRLRDLTLGMVGPERTTLRLPRQKNPHVSLHPKAHGLAWRADLRRLIQSAGLEVR
jgi:hypothetical protein